LGVTKLCFKRERPQCLHIAYTVSALFTLKLIYDVWLHCGGIVLSPNFTASGQPSSHRHIRIPIAIGTHPHPSPRFAGSGQASAHSHDLSRLAGIGISAYRFLTRDCFATLAMTDDTHIGTSAHRHTGTSSPVFIRQQPQCIKHHHKGRSFVAYNCRTNMRNP
jgi:hypothetical protein